MTEQTGAWSENITRNLLLHLMIYITIRTIHPLHSGTSPAIQGLFFFNSDAHPSLSLSLSLCVCVCVCVCVFEYVNHSKLICPFFLYISNLPVLFSTCSMYPKYRRDFFYLTCVQFFASRLFLVDVTLFSFPAGGRPNACM